MNECAEIFRDVHGAYAEQHQNRDPGRNRRLPPRSRHQSLQDGVKDSAQVTSKITSDARRPCHGAEKYARADHQIQCSWAKSASRKAMFQTAQTLESILGGTKSRVRSVRSRSNACWRIPSHFRNTPRNTASAAVKSRRHHFPARQKNDGCGFQVSSRRLPRIGAEGDDARKAFVSSIKATPIPLRAIHRS